MVKELPTDHASWFYLEPHGRGSQGNKRHQYRQREIDSRIQYYPYILQGEVPFVGEMISFHNFSSKQKQ